MIFHSLTSLIKTPQAIEGMMKARGILYNIGNLIVWSLASRSLLMADNRWPSLYYQAQMHHNKYALLLNHR